MLYGGERLPRLNDPLHHCLFYTHALGVRVQHAVQRSQARAFCSFGVWPDVVFRAEVRHKIRSCPMTRGIR